MSADPEKDYYSARMRAAAGGAHEQGGRHLSGAERLVPADRLDAAILELMERGRTRDPQWDFLRLTVEKIPAATITRIPCLPVTTITVSGPDESRSCAEQILADAGIARAVIAQAFETLRNGWAAGGRALRGAAIVDSQSGRRVDADLERGVRVSRFDYSPEGYAEIVPALASHGLTHFRTREALALASKVLWSGLCGELCWSDEPDYAAGYIATESAGYVRFPHFKLSRAVGGRVFFLDRAVMTAEECIERLEKRSTLIVPPVRIREAAYPFA